MRILIRHGDEVAKLYWVQREKDRVVGWFDGGIYASILNLPPNIKPDLHFTYPSDGNLHCSLKYNNSEENKKYYINAYKFTVRIKTICNATGNREDFVVPRESLPGNALSFFVPQDDLPNFEDYKTKAIFHQFSVYSFRIENGYSKLPRSEVIQNFANPRIDDLVLNTNDFKSAHMNISAILVGRGYESQIPFKKGMYLEDNTVYPKIFLGCYATD